MMYCKWKSIKIKYNKIIDSGYRGEWFVPLTNHNTVPVVLLKESYAGEQSVFDEAIIYPYEKAMSQCILVEVPKVKTAEISYEALMQFESERGTGMLGSSGK